MDHIESMLRSHREGSPMDAAMLARCIRACYDCAQTCTACADACLGEDNLRELVRCIRLNLDCADVCETTGRMMSRVSAVDIRLLHGQLDACIAACQICGDECRMHSGKYEHCRMCADSCFQCLAECKEMLRTVQAAVH